MSHQWIENVWKDRIDKSVLLVQHTSHVDMLVHEESVGTHVIKLYR